MDDKMYICNNARGNGDSSSILSSIRPIFSALLAVVVNAKQTETVRSKDIDLASLYYLIQSCCYLF